VDRSLVTASLVEGALHALEGIPVDHGADQHGILARIADRHGGVDLREARHQAVVDALVHEKPAQGGAALARRSHGGEGDGAKGEIEVGGRSDDGAVVAPELQDGAGEAGGELRTDLPAHDGRARGRDHRHAPVRDQRLADVPTSDQHGR
jgi:hypothetical protein